MADILIAHTADLDADTIRAIRALLKKVFGHEISAEGWRHALGGMHAVVHESGEVIAHGSVVQRQLLYAGRVLRTGYVEGVAVLADRRGEGHAAAVMAELERIIRGGYDLGGLSSTKMAAGFYGARGWRRRRGATFALTPKGTIRTAWDDGNVWVLPVDRLLDFDGEITCDWRDGEVW